jgi:hypothetical protein
MADMEKPKMSDPEKVAALSRNTTSGDGEVKDPIFMHADPNDGDEAYVPFPIPVWHHVDCAKHSTFVPPSSLEEYIKWQY